MSIPASAIPRGRATSADAAGAGRDADSVGSAGTGGDAMVTVAVDRRSRLPLAHQVERLLKTRIIDGVYAAGEKLEREQVLAREFGVSRATLRLALDTLADGGLVSREQGRGTFVRAVPAARRGYTLRGDLDDLLVRSTLGREPEAQMSVSTVESFSPTVRARLGAGPVGGKIVERVLTDRAVPYGYLLDYIPAPFDAMVSEAALAGGGVLQALEQSGVVIARAVQTINATEATAQIGARLGLATGTAVLVVERSVITATEEIAAFTMSYYVGDLYRDVVEFTRPSSK